jgi:dTDP-4-dehydrorhamnose 3,5-epimerase
MGNIDVNQIKVTQLKRIKTAGGDVLHGMKCDDIGYLGFGEAYFSVIEGSAIKAWKRHSRMTLNLIVPIGLVQFVFVDDKGQYRLEVVGVDRYVRLTVPPGIWFGFKGMISPFSMLLNIADISHDQQEIERLDLNQIKFNWEKIR